MSERATALRGDSFAGYVSISEDTPRAMVQLKGDLAADALAAAVGELTGADLPGPLAMTTGARGQVAWMAPDELLLLLPAGQGPDAAARLGEALGDTPHLALDVSDMRAAIRLEGAGLREVLAKAVPIDMAPCRFEPGAFRRTRLAQVPAAVWMSGPDTAHVICFRSVARYVFDVLAAGAQEGGEVGVF